MKNLIPKLYFVISVISIIACSTTPKVVGQSKLEATEFQRQINSTTNPQILDVRTEREFNDGHIANANNLNIYADDFNQKLDLLDKNDTIFVYCKAGGRSADAAKRLAAKGFKNVYDLDGGFMKWEHAKLPVAGSTAIAEMHGISLTVYDSVIQSQQLVVVDFYAPWCGPCKMMAPYLKKMQATYPEDKLKIVKIDVDQNKMISDHFQISSIPMIKIYHQGKEVFSNVGMVTEAQMMQALKSYL